MSLTMYSITCTPSVATALAGYQIDERLRDARGRRLARDARQARMAPAPASDPQPRRRSWSFVLLRHAFG
jgi:hypothetical protein